MVCGRMWTRHDFVGHHFISTSAKPTPRNICVSQCPIASPDGDFVQLVHDGEHAGKYVACHWIVATGRITLLSIVRDPSFQVTCHQSRETMTHNNKWLASSANSWLQPNLKFCRFIPFSI